MSGLETGWAVQHKPKGSRRWANVETFATQADVFRAMFDSMDGSRPAGDWRVSEVTPKETSK